MAHQFTADELHPSGLDGTRVVISDDTTSFLYVSLDGEYASRVTHIDDPETPWRVEHFWDVKGTSVTAGARDYATLMLAIAAVVQHIDDEKPTRIVTVRNHNGSRETSVINICNVDISDYVNAKPYDLRAEAYCVKPCEITITLTDGGMVTYDQYDKAMV